MPKLMTPAFVRATAATAIGLFLFLLVVEIGGAVFFYRDNHRLVYANELPRAAAPPAEEKTYKQRLHPYFGFAGPYSESFHLFSETVYTNSLGFFQREPLTLPVARGDADFIVAVFGGSVAANMILAPRGGLQLGLALQKLPALAGKHIVVINMAQGSGKQPQQLLEFAFLLAFGQSLDLAVTVDGFNELALGLESYKVGLDPILPAGGMIGGIANEVLQATAGSVEYYEIAHGVSAAKRDIERRKLALQSARFGTTYLVDRALLALDDRTLRKYLERYSDAVGRASDWPARKQALGLDMPVDLARADKVRELFDLWMRSARQMRLLADANHIGYLHIVQPNQYFTKKTFTDKESRTALSLPPDHPYRVGLVEGYRMLESPLAAQAEPGLISAIPLFDVVREEIFVDNCCHFNAHGETMLSEFVAARVADWLAAHAKRGP